jgi:hypothetical protein
LVLNNVFSLGYVPEILGPVFPLISDLAITYFKIWASPEKVFSYPMSIEFMIVRSAFNFQN